MARKGSMEQAIKDATIQEKTGRPWAEWLSVLDEFGVEKAGHKAAARYLREDHDQSAWWAQTLTVRYEQERGLRELGQRANGFEGAVTRTIRATPEAAYEALTTAEGWDGWLSRGSELDARVDGLYRTADGDRGRFLGLEPPRRVRMTWEHPKHPPGSRVTFEIAPKDEGRITVRVTHARLADQPTREELVKAWRGAMDSLRAYLESVE